jgi:hypothetical protein
MAALRTFAQQLREIPQRSFARPPSGRELADLELDSMEYCHEKN